VGFSARAVPFFLFIGWRAVFDASRFDPRRSLSSSVNLAGVRAYDRSCDRLSASGSEFGKVWAAANEAREIRRFDRFLVTPLATGPPAISVGAVDTAVITSGSSKETGLHN